MKEVKGKYGTAKIFTDLVEDSAVDQVKTLMDQNFVEGSKVRMMPDIHTGKGCTIGTTMTIKDKVCPNLVGVDIGCGMLCVKLSVKEPFNLMDLDFVIRRDIPAGFNVRDEAHPFTDVLRLGELWCKDSVDIERAKLSLGTLGGGNHFIELDKDNEGNYYLVMHTGSRHLGVEVANYYQNWACLSDMSSYVTQRNDIIQRLKDEGREREIEGELKRLKEESMTPTDLCWVGGPLFKSYIHDMEIVQEYASWNRKAIAMTIISLMGFGFNAWETFETIHNYIDTDDMILRKGAVSAKKDERLLIPMNMRDGSLLCVGKGNPDWNYSAPHGAGRLMSRGEAKRKFSIDEFEKSMDGVFTTSVGIDTIDECPMAYKPMESIIENIGDTVDILKVLKPVYNFKAGA